MWVGIIQSTGGPSKTKGRERTFLFELGHPSYSALRLWCSFSWAGWGLRHWFLWFPGLWAWIGPPASRWQVVVLSFHNLRREHFRIKSLFLFVCISLLLLFLWRLCRQYKLLWQPIQDKRYPCSNPDNPSSSLWVLLHSFRNAYASVDQEVNRWGRFDSL